MIEPIFSFFFQTPTDEDSGDGGDDDASSEESDAGTAAGDDFDLDESADGLEPFPQQGADSGLAAAEAAAAADPCLDQDEQLMQQEAVDSFDFLEPGADNTLAAWDNSQGARGGQFDDFIEPLADDHQERRAVGACEQAARADNPEMTPERLELLLRSSDSSVL